MGLSIRRDQWIQNNPAAERRKPSEPLGDQKQRKSPSLSL
jgi:hypothetical protein